MLTQLTRWWFDQLPEVPNHLAYAEDDRLELPADPRRGRRPRDAVPHPRHVPDRVRRARLPHRRRLEGVPGDGRHRRHPAARRARRTATGCPSRSTRPRGRRRWASTTRTSRTSAPSSSSGETVGRAAARACRSRSSRTRSAIAEERGLILADTKFEFGADRDIGIVTLADEVLTSDSSRYWDAEAYATGATPEQRMASFDKQIVRDWLAANWDQDVFEEPPTLPHEIVGADRRAVPRAARPADRPGPDAPIASATSLPSIAAGCRSRRHPFVVPVTAPPGRHGRSDVTHRAARRHRGRLRRGRLARQQAGGRDPLARRGVPRVAVRARRRHVRRRAAAQSPSAGEASASSGSAVVRPDAWAHRPPRAATSP